jgi:hypothetical protein
VKIALVLMSAGCAPSDNAPSLQGDTPVVDVVATGLAFEAPSELPSGWTTFRLKNESGMIHFALLERLPEGVGIKEQQEQVAPVFQQGMDLLNAGNADAALEKFGELPEWFGQLVFMGGPGLISPGQTGQASVFLEPGTYLLECYVKTGGVFHSYNPDPSTYGMILQFTVTEAASGAPEPEATLEIRLSSEHGIEVEGEVVPGEHTVAVHFEDQKVHENFVGHDVHLVRLSGDTDLDELATWMDWTQPTGLESPAPVQFLGGTQEMPAGETAYFSVSLEPGRYAWIAEVPGAEDKGMFVTFSVPPATDGR